MSKQKTSVKKPVMTIRALKKLLLKEPDPRWLIHLEDCTKPVIGLLLSSKSWFTLVGSSRHPKIVVFCDPDLPLSKTRRPKSRRVKK